MANMIDCKLYITVGKPCAAPNLAEAVAQLLANGEGDHLHRRSCHLSAGAQAT